MTKGNTSSATKRLAVPRALSVSACMQWHFAMLLIPLLLHAEPSRPTLPPEERTNGQHTLAAIEKYGVGDGISYISTGGGAFLEFVEGKVLPAVEVLEQRAS